MTEMPLPESLDTGKVLTKADCVQCTAEELPLILEPISDDVVERRDVEK